MRYRNRVGSESGRWAAGDFLGVSAPSLPGAGRACGPMERLEQLQHELAEAERTRGDLLSHPASGGGLGPTVAAAARELEEVIVNLRNQIATLPPPPPPASPQQKHEVEASG